MPTPWPQPEPEKVKPVSAELVGTLTPHAPRARTIAARAVRARWVLVVPVVRFGVGAGGAIEGSMGDGATVTASARRRSDLSNPVGVRGLTLCDAGAVTAIVGASGARGGAARTGTGVRVATFNIRHGRPEGAAGADPARLTEALARIDAAVLAVQEVDRRTGRVMGADQVRSIAEATGSEVRFAPALDHDGGEYGVALASRSGFGHSEVLRLPGPGEPRVALLARIRAGLPAAAGDSGEEWAVGCTHLSTDPGVATRQLRRVLGSLDEVAGGRPAVLLGDLNLGPRPVGPVLVDAGFVAAPSGPTHPARRPSRRIDWVLVRGAVVRSSGVLDVTCSDHRPLTAVLERTDRHSGVRSDMDDDARVP